jgi:hypothetical protein
MLMASPIPPIISGEGARLRARIAGVLYLGTIVTGVSALLLRMGMIVPGDAATTASHIQAAEGLFRLAFAAEVVGTACYVGVTALLYELLKPAGHGLSRLAAFFSLVGCAVGAASQSNMLVAMVLLERQPYLTAVFAPSQLEALALTALKLHNFGTTIGMVFFGVYCAAIGVLIFRSGYLPRMVGALLMLAGAGWLADCFTYFLNPPLSRAIGDVMLMAGFVGEASLTAWLLAVGLNASRWDARSGATQLATA